MEVSRELDYQKKSLSYPRYRYTKKAQQTGPSVIPMTVSGGTEVIVQAPQAVINYSKSYVRCRIHIPAAGGTLVNALHSANIPLFQTVQFVGESGNNIIDIPNCDTYTRIVNWTDTDMDSYLSHDLFTVRATTAGINGAINGIRKNNYLGGNDVPVQFPGYNQTVPAVAAGVGVPQIVIDINATDPVDSANTTYARPVSTTAVAAPDTPISANIAYDEPLYAMMGAANTVMYFDYSLPLSEILPNTFWALDKDMYLPMIMNLRFIFNSSDKIAWKMTNANSFSAGAVTLTTPPDITDFSVYFAIEQDESIRAGLKEKVMTTGMDLYVPYVQANSRGMTGSTQSVSYTYKRANGDYLYKIYHTIKHSKEQFHNAYNMNNGVGNSGDFLPANQKAQVYYTQLDSNERLQQSDVVCANQDDWFYMKEKLKGSVLGQSADLYHYNWVHVDHFVGESKLCEDKYKYNEQLVAGIDLKAKDTIWDFVGTTINDGGQTYNHYTYAVILRRLVINSNGYAWV